VSKEKKELPEVKSDSIFVIDGEVANAVLAYLGERPIKEAAQLYNSFSQVKNYQNFVKANKIVD